MSRIVLARLALDSLAAVLMVAALAYWWLGNLAHEVIGTALFGLVALHAWFNRRWYLGLFRGRYDARRGAAAAVNLAFLVVMAVVLVTSILMSRDVFAFLGIEADFRMRDIHMFASYWAVALLGVHLGLNWLIVMNVTRGALGLRGRHPLRTWGLRAATACIALQGVQASTEMTFGTKLALSHALDMWDFTSQVPRFFVNYGAIIGLYAVIGHYARLLLTGLRRRAPLPPTR